MDDDVPATKSREATTQETFAGHWSDRAFTEFFRQEFYPVAAFVMRATGANAADAKECAQAAFAIAWQKWATLRNRNAWIRTVALRQLYRSTPGVEKLTDSVPDAIDRNDPETELELGQSNQRVQDLLATLPTMQRITMAFRLDGFSDEEIAAQIKSTPVAVRKSRQRAREALRQKLMDQGLEAE